MYSLARLWPFLPHRRLHWKALYRCSVVVVDLFCMSRKTGDMQKRRIEDPTSIGSVRGLCTDSATTPQNRSTTAEADLLLVFEKWTKSSSEAIIKADMLIV